MEHTHLGGKKTAVPQQQNKGCNHIQEHSRPKSDQIIFQNCYVYIKFDEQRGFSTEIAKQIKIVAKAKPGVRVTVRLWPPAVFFQKI